MHNDPEAFRRLFEGIQGPDEKQMRRAARGGVLLFGIALFLFLLLGSLQPYTEWLWFTHDVRQPEVFTTAYSTRGSLFLITFVVAWGFLHFNLRRALSATLIYLNAPETRGQAALANLVQWLQRQGSLIVKIGAPLLAIFTAIGFSNEWNTYLLAKNAQSFGMTDPTYGLDLGFFVFSLPWYRALSNAAFSLLLLTTTATIAVYVGLQVLASLAKIELNRPHFRIHVSLLIGLTLITLAAQHWLKTYEAGLDPSGQFTGAGHAAMQAVMVRRVFAIVTAILAIGTILTANRGRPYAFAIGSGVVLAAIYLVGLVFAPNVIQSVIVNPNRLNLERPYAQNAIKMTNFGYGLDKIESQNFEPIPAPTQKEIDQADSTLRNMRLWDPFVMNQALEANQAVRPYYAFNDVDIDRYTINGRQTMLMLSPRDLRMEGLEANAQNWLNQRLRYTHGYGITVSRVTQTTENGQPVFLAQGIPQQASPELPVKEPRIYFSDRIDGQGRVSDQYAIVNTDELELDFPTSSGEETHRWQGNRGIPLGGFLQRLAFALVVKDGNLLISKNIKPESRLLIRRNIWDRASRVFPFLQLDRDPYIVVHEGRLVWMLDAYTTTAMVPYSSYLAGPGSVNYIRNSVKIVMDAYTGEITAYASQPDEPILKAYRKIYPKLVKDVKEMPEGLIAHWRYPEDLLQFQASKLTNFHVKDPTIFLTNADAWQIAQERDLGGSQSPVKPYYVQMTLPGEAKEGFYQILPFSPRGRQNMSGWIAAHCDPGSYGRLTLYRFTGSTPIEGPGLMEANFSSTPEISNINRQFNNEQSEIVVGNLLVIPIGRSVMYAEALFLRSRTQGMQSVPRLFRVILALNSDQIVVAENYEEALNLLFKDGTPGNVASSLPTTPGQPATPGTGTARRVQDPAALREVLKLLNEAEAALKSGDFGKYGDLQKSAKRKLEQLVGPL